MDSEQTAVASQSKENSPLVAALVDSEPPPLAQPPVRWRELLVLAVLVALSDLTVYRGDGYAGIALLLAAIVPLLWVGKPAGPRHVTGAVLTGGMLVILAARMVWSGTVVHILIGVALLFGFSLSLADACPYMLDVLLFPARLVVGGAQGLIFILRSAAQLWDTRDRNQQTSGSHRWFRFLSFALPLAVVVVFSLLFVLANPDLLDALGRNVQQVIDAIRSWVFDQLPPVAELFFWTVVLWFSVGLIRPMILKPLVNGTSPFVQKNASSELKPASSPWYATCRNTLAAVNILFAIYLVFEFSTLWFREFPKGFYYSGYAHQGAAWLTIALALATVVLSVVFQGDVLRDPNVRKLRRLAWIWSLENLLLVVAVYHRLYIYIGFNGLTRMRIVGFFGMSAVVIGFLLVLWKIAWNRPFLWLVHRHAWTLAMAVYLFALTPVDAIVVSFNVRRILAGDPAPSVQISVHEISSEGVPLLIRLLESDNKIIREGVRAMLADFHDQSTQLAARRRQAGWTAFQIADQRLFNCLQAESENWVECQDLAVRRRKRERFDQYAYQWY